MKDDLAQIWKEQEQKNTPKPPENGAGLRAMKTRLKEGRTNWLLGSALIATLGMLFFWGTQSLGGSREYFAQHLVRIETNEKTNNQGSLWQDFLDQWRSRNTLEREDQS